jgi:hypothetical protein
MTRKAYGALESKEEEVIVFCLKVQLVMKISRKNLNRKIVWKIFQKIFPFFIRTVDMVSLFTFYIVIIMLIYTSLSF